MEEEKTKIYHERQRLQLCLLHSLNNLFQTKDAFTRSHLNSIAHQLDVDDPNTGGSWTPFSVVFKPHHNEITGNYDINVLIAALQQKGKTVVWHDSRNGASSIDLDDDHRLMGIVVNVAVRKFSGLWRSRHWVTLRCIEGVWYNLDSDFAAPYAFRDTQHVREFLDGLITADAQVFLVLNHSSIANNDAL